jgi:hypothetical protein
LPSDRSAIDSVQARGRTCDLSKSVPRKELSMADGSISDTFYKFSIESSPSLSLSSSSSNYLRSNDESIHQGLPPTTSAPMTDIIQIKRVMIMLQQKIMTSKN